MLVILFVLGDSTTRVGFAHDSQLNAGKPQSPIVRYYHANI